MSGCDYVENLNDDQLQALGGGPILQMECSSLTSEFRRFIRLKYFILRITLFFKIFISSSNLNY